MSSDDETDRPLLRVVRGEPTSEELAALIAVVTARSTTSPAGPAFRSAWTDRSRLVRRCPPTGPGAWRNSGWRA